MSRARRGGSQRSGLVIGAALLLAIGVAGGIGFERLMQQPDGRPPSATGRPITLGAAGAGPTAVIDGMPVGYARTRQGAAQAAGNYLAAIGGHLALDAGRAKAALDRIAEPSARQRLENSLAATLKGDEALWGIRAAADRGQRVVFTQTPIAYRVEAFTPDEATVLVWMDINVAVDGRQRLTAFFAIGQATLTWVDDDWRLRAFDPGRQETDVVPVCVQTPTPTGGVPERLDGFVPYGA